LNSTHTVFSGSPNLLAVLIMCNTLQNISNPNLALYFCMDRVIRTGGNPTRGIFSFGQPQPINCQDKTDLQ